MPERATRHDELADGWAREADVLSALRSLWGATYVLRGAKPPETLNCSWVVATALRAWGVPLEQSQLFLWNPATEPWGPVSAAIESGIAEEVTEPGPWTVCQGWTGDAPGTGSGHSFLVLDTAGDKWLSIEGHDRWGGGLVARNLGQWERLGNPGELWHYERPHPGPPLWSELPWKSIKMARLRVFGAGDWLKSGKPWPGGATV